MGSPTARYPEVLPAGGEYWVSADADWYRSRGYLEVVGENDEPVFVEPRDAGELEVRGVPAARRHGIVASATYTALYVGRSIYQHNPAASAYVSGEGLRQIWDPVDPVQATRSGAYFTVARCAPEPRIGFRDIARGTDERTFIAAVLAADAQAGNKVPIFVVPSPAVAFALTGLLNSFVLDALIRIRVNTTINWTYVRGLPVPTPDRLAEAIPIAAQLGATLPELASAWNDVSSGLPWTYASAERDPWKRGELRAELDAIVADAYGLSVPEYARILTAFPLLDRNEPVLAGDAFVTDAEGTPKGERGVAWEETPFGVYERRPRSFVTRDLALLTYMRRKGYAPPQRLDLFFRDEVGIDPIGPLSRFRIGEHKDLIDRVELARRAGAVPYVPSGRGGGGDESSEDETADGVEA